MKHIGYDDDDVVCCAGIGRFGMKTIFNKFTKRVLERVVEAHRRAATRTKSIRNHVFMVIVHTSESKQFRENYKYHTQIPSNEKLKMFLEQCMKEGR